MTQLARRWRALLLLYGLGWMTAAVLSTVIVLGMADYLVRFQDRGVRMICSLAALAVVGWAVFRYLWPALAARSTSVRLAQQVEKHFPGLADRLASTMYFLSRPEEEPKEGSAALRRAIVNETSMAAEQLDLTEALDRRPTRQALMAAAVVGGVAIALAVISPTASRIALTRLARPWGGDAWPQRHHLAFLVPVHRIASGQNFEVEVVDSQGVRLPDQVWIEYRRELPSGEIAEDRQPAKIIGEVVVARQDNVTRSFDYRAVGGDDDSMPWVHAEVLDPPVVERLAIELHYPSYTGWPTKTGDKQLRAIIGTRVGLAGAVSKPLRRATLHRDGAPPLPLILNADRLGFALPPQSDPGFVVEQTGSYWFELEDTDGLTGGPELKYEMRAIPDAPPTVVIEEPATDLQLTPRARVPLKFASKDDLAIARVSRIVDRSDQSDRPGEQVVLFQGPPQVAAGAADASSNNEAGDQRIVEEFWDLESMQLKPGTQITLQASAVDYRPAESRSTPRRITVITPEELDERLSERQGFLATELARLLKLQQEARNQVGGLGIQLREVGKLEAPDRDRLQNAEMTQRQIARGLTDTSNGLRGQVNGLLADIANNRVENADVEERMQQLGEEIDRLAREPLPKIERELTNARKQSQPADDSGAAPQPESARNSLDQAALDQDEVIEAIERQLAALSQWDSYRQFHRDLGQLRRDQERISEETARLGRETMAKALQDLTPQQRADLQKTSEEQQALARRLEKVQQQMSQTARQLGEGDPAVESITDALSRAQEANLPSQMREAGRSVGNNQIGQASARQKNTLDELREMLDILANRREQSRERLVGKLRAAESEVAAMRKQQAGLRKRIEAANKEPDEAERRRQLERLAKEEQRLAEEANRLARRLERLQAESASRSAQSAAGSLGKAGEAGSQGEGQQAGDSAQQAEQDLAQAQAEIAQARRQAELDLAFEQLAKMRDALVGLHGREEEVIGEAARIEKIRQEQGRLTRGQAESVGQLAKNQRQIGSETTALSEKLGAAEAFSLALRRAADEMARAAEHFDQQQTNAQAQATAGRAARRLALLLSALEADKPAAQQQKQQQDESAGGGAQGGAAGQQPGDGIADIAQLKLIKLMQEDVNLRTRELDEAIASDGSLTPQRQEEYTRLSEEQGQLADLLSNLAPVTESAIEDEPDKLPDLREPGLHEAEPIDDSPVPNDAEPGGEEPSDSAVPGNEEVTP